MRRLDLRKETLSELTSDELDSVVGGTMPTKINCTVSHQVCDPGVTRDMCAETFSACIVRTRLCVQTR